MRELGGYIFHLSLMTEGEKVEN